MLTNSINNFQPNFQARIKIDKSKATGALCVAASSIGAGLWSAGEGLQANIAEHLVQPGTDNLVSLNDVQSVRNYVNEGQEALRAHENYLEVHDGRPSDLEGIQYLLASTGITSSGTGAYLSNVASKALYRGEIAEDNVFVDSLKIPTDKD